MNTNSAPPTANGSTGHHNCPVCGRSSFEVSSFDAVVVVFIAAVVIEVAVDTSAVADDIDGGKVVCDISPPVTDVTLLTVVIVVVVLVTETEVVVLGIPVTSPQSDMVLWRFFIRN